MSRIERLINLTATLLDADRFLTRDEVVERVPGYGGTPESVRRAFERDKETLRELGVPVETGMVDPTNEDSPEGYRIPRRAYELPDPGLDPDELAAIHLAARTVRLPGAESTEALWKLGGKPATGDPLAATAMPIPTRAELPGAAHLVDLFQAWGERRTVSFTYRSQARTVDPWRLSFRNGHWYLVGRDHAADDERNFRVDRIESAVEIGTEANAFDRPAHGDTDGAESPPWLLGGDAEPVVATVRVDADQAGWTTSFLGPESVVEREPDGSIVVDVPVTNRDAFRSFVLGYLDHAELLAPAELRAELIEYLEDLCRR
jgi:proteasome accessory factor B